MSTLNARWIQAVIDIPAQDFLLAASFWADITASELGPVHPDHPEFIHLRPADGDMHLELQRIENGRPSVHLDLLVDDIAAATELAIATGAELVANPGHAVLRTPGGVPFCLVPFSGESKRQSAVDPDLRHVVDQICLDVPHNSFDDDVEFWSKLTGWAVNPPVLPEFRSFAQPDQLPLRLLVQRLGLDDVGGARAHLDISSGENVAALTERHVAAGASLVEAHEFWTALSDPAGLLYCLTARQPS